MSRYIVKKQCAKLLESDDYILARKRYGYIISRKNQIRLLDEILPKQLITAKLGGNLSEILHRDHQLCEVH